MLSGLTGVSLLQAIIVLIIGVIIWAVSRALPPGVATAAYWVGIIIAIIGVILVVIAVLS
jgi:hypothetical protein